MTPWFIYFLINLVSIFASVCSIFVSSTINLLLYIVIIIFSQGMSLLMMSTNIISLYLIIVYLGAIVILFSFMILFVNWKDETPSLNPLYQALSFVVLLVTFTLLIHELGVENISLTSWGGLHLDSEFDVMQGIAIKFYGELLVPLLIMVSILMLGLVLVIKIILRPEH